MLLDSGYTDTTTNTDTANTDTNTKDSIITNDPMNADIADTNCAVHTLCSYKVQTTCLTVA